MVYISCSLVAILNYKEYSLDIMDKSETADKNKSTAVEAKIDIIPKTWPGAFGIYKNSKAAVMVNLVPIIELWALNIVVNIVLNYVPLIGRLVSSLFSIFIATCIYHMYLAGIHNNKMELSEAVDKTSKLYIRMVGLYILIFLTCLSFLLLVIPGLIIVPRVLLAPYFLIEKNMNAVEAYKASWNATRGNVGKMYAIFGVILLMLLPIITVVGILLSIYWIVLYGAATAILYKFITKKSVQA